MSVIVSHPHVLANGIVTQTPSECGSTVKRHCFNGSLAMINMEMMTMTTMTAKMMTQMTTVPPQMEMVVDKTVVGIAPQAQLREFQQSLQG